MNLFLKENTVIYIFKFYSFYSRDLFNWDESKQKAVENFKAQREFMHQTTAALVAKDLSL